MDTVRTIGKFEGWMTVQEAAHYIEISRVAVHYNIRMGKLTAKRAGRAFLVEEASAKRLKNERKSR